jgi:hypothetical protein
MGLLVTRSVGIFYIKTPCSFLAPGAATSAAAASRADVCLRAGSRGWLPRSRRFRKKALAFSGNCAFLLEAQTQSASLSYCPSIPHGRRRRYRSTRRSHAGAVVPSASPPCRRCPPLRPLSRRRFSAPPRLLLPVAPRFRTAAGGAAAPRAARTPTPSSHPRPRHVAGSRLRALSPADVSAPPPPAAPLRSYLPDPGPGTAAAAAAARAAPVPP